MSLVSNFAGGISPLQIGKEFQKITNDFDMNDHTFADLLNTKMLGMDSSMMPKGVNILDFQNSNLNTIQTGNSIDKNPVKDMTTSEVVTFTKSLFDSSNMQNERSPLYNFSRKNAADFYSKYSKNSAMNLAEFVEDTIKSN